MVTANRSRKPDMANRASVAVHRTRQQIKDKGISEAKPAKSSKDLDMAFDEYCKFQELKSLGMLQDKLSLEEAQTVYGYLGETPDHFNGQPVEVKVVLTQLFKELLESHIREAV